MNIVITEAALHELQRNKETPVQYYRMVVTPGGCSGFKYGLYFESTPEDDDFIVDASEDVKILIDAFSGQYLEGIHLDYMKTLTLTSKDITQKQWSNLVLELNLIKL